VIAELAGVGVGTVYRHFPTKDALREALILERLRALLAELDAATREEPEAWPAFRRFFLAGADLQIRDRSLMQFIAGVTISGHELERERSRLYARARTLMRAAQREGTMRADVDAGDLPLLLGGIAQVIAGAGPRAVEFGERLVAIVLDGLAAPGSTPLRGRGPSQQEIGELFYGAVRPAEQGSERSR